MQYLCLKYSGKVFETFFYYIKKCNKFFKKVQLFGITLFRSTQQMFIRMPYLVGIHLRDKGYPLLFI